MYYKSNFVNWCRLVETNTVNVYTQFNSTHVLIIPGNFDLLVYTDKDLEVPESWGESGPQFIADSEEVRLRSFTTTIHKVDAMVAYKKSN